MIKQAMIPLGLILTISAAALLVKPADAHERGFVDFRFGPSYPSYYAPVVERPIIASPGYYQTQYQSVLVEPEHKVRQFVPPVYETRRDVYGRPYTVIVREGYYTEACVPARYESRPVQVFVPGCAVQAPVSVYAPAPVYRPRASLFFKF